MMETEWIQAKASCIIHSIATDFIFMQQNISLLFCDLLLEKDFGFFSPP